MQIKLFNEGEGKIQIEKKKKRIEGEHFRNACVFWLGKMTEMQ